MGTICGMSIKFWKNLLASDETVEREFGVLERIGDNYPKYVVTMDEINRSRNGIKHKNIRDFLLQEEYV